MAWNVFNVDILRNISKDDAGTLGKQLRISMVREIQHPFEIDPSGHVRHNSTSMLGFAATQ